MDDYDNFSACQRISSFLDALSNWYVRRSRARFWAGAWTDDKRDAYWTLYECLITLCRLVAPFVPFLAEEIWQNLAVQVFGERTRKSVHLCDYPHPVPELVDEKLSAWMDAVRELVSLGRAARMNAKVKVRQPLARVEIVVADREHLPWLQQHTDLIAEELNVKRIDWLDRADELIEYTILPDFKRLGPRLGKLLPAVKKWLTEADGGAVLRQLEESGQVNIPLSEGDVILTKEDVQVRLNAKSGWTAAQGRVGVVILSTELTPELLAEGLARDFVHAVQNRRKDLDCDFTERIEIGIVTHSDTIKQAISDHQDYILSETLGTSVQFCPLPGTAACSLKIGNEEIELYVKPLRS